MLRVFLNYCSRHVISNQSNHSPMTVLMNKAFPSAEHFLDVGFFGVGWGDSRDCCVRENRRSSGVSESLKPAHLASATKVTEIRLILILMFNVNIH